MAGIKNSHPLLEMELKTKFGVPGRVSPDLSTVLCAVREGEPPLHSRSAGAATQASQTIDLDKLADLVAQRLQGAVPTAAATGVTSPSAPSPVSSAPTGGMSGALFGATAGTSFGATLLPRHSRRRVLCYKCGLYGHIARHCNNAPNPALVREMRAKNGL